jgi:hypothetical protein
MNDRMTHREWAALADRVLKLDDVQLHSIVLKFLAVTDAKTATAAIDKGLADVAHHANRTATTPPPGGLPSGDCPGCVGRGTGWRCCVCGRMIPPQLRRAPGSPDEIREGCPDCRVGRAHTHGGRQ